jgi:SDR family mycofactocin-dependent oxidoreductase
MQDRLAGKVAFITGVARGQGRAHAVRLAHDGADIAGIDICAQIPSCDYALATSVDLQATKRLVEQAGRRMIGHIADVRDRTAVQSAFDDTLEVFGRVDFVVANAGIMPIWGRHAQTDEAWQDCIDVMLTGVLNTVEAAWPHMVERGDGGSIVITSSIGGVRPAMRTLDGRTIGLLAYCAAKAGVVSLMENYASVLAEHSIRVNTVHPAAINTPMIDNELVRTREATARPEDLQSLMHALPVGAMDAAEVANAVAWLCSDDSRFYTGNQLLIDAGAHLR